MLIYFISSTKNYIPITMPQVRLNLQRYVCKCNSIDYPFIAYSSVQHIDQNIFFFNNHQERDHVRNEEDSRENHLERF